MKKRIDELKQDPANVNQHAERGSALTRKSIEKFGARLAGIVDRNGVIIDGNDRQIAYGEIDMNEVEVIEADPLKPVYLKFNDLDLADPNNPARELQVALHRSAVESWTVDAEALLAHMQSGLEVDDWYRQKEIDELLSSVSLEFEGAETVNGAGGGYAGAVLEQPVGPSHVRQVQLFFNTETHPGFVRMTEALATYFGTTNITDTVMAVVDHAYTQLDL